MPGPYFEGQIVDPCGCYYPDVTRVGMDANTKESIRHCINHGEYHIPVSPKVVWLNERMSIPPEEWREEERKRIRSEADEQRKLKPTCKECGFSARPRDFDRAPSVYHDLKCPQCGSTNIDWTYGSYVGNTLQTSRSSR